MAYTELILFAVVLAGLGGLVWACYRWGVAAERAKSARLSIELQRKIDEVVQAGMRDRLEPLDDRWLREGSPDRPAGPDLPPAPPRV